METYAAPALRVALIAGTLGKGGAEKQLVYMARALHQAGVQVRVYSLTRGEYYEQALETSGLAPIYVGLAHNPALRLFALMRAMRGFRPQIVQSAHFYTNLYAALAGRWLRALSIGAIRSGMRYEVGVNGRWSAWLVRLPAAMIANSHPAMQNAVLAGVKPERIDVLPNVIDLGEFARASGQALESPVHGREDESIRVALVARMVPEKRVDRFIRVLARARQQHPALQGWVIGDGPLRAQMESLARSLGLLPEGLLFLGERHDVPALLCQSHILALSSDTEGFPNAILEGMAAGLPVITTPAGESASVVVEDQTGFVAPFEDEEAFAQQLTNLAAQSALRERLGLAGRRRVEALYSFESLAGRMLAMYHQFALRQSQRQILRVLGEGGK